jgi:hypothetical protein
MRQRLLISIGLLTAGLAGGWALARSHDDPAEAKPNTLPTVTAGDTANEGPLDMLDWLAGDWVDASDNVSVEFSCNFTKNNAFLVRSFRIVNANDVKLSGMQLIAWDAAQQTIRSWTYDSRGGFGEETWSQNGNKYTIRAKYTLPDGGTGSNMQVVNYIDDNKFTWKSVNREIDGEFLPDTDEIVLVRKPASDDAKGGK